MIYLILAGLVLAIITAINVVKAEPMPEYMEERPAYRPRAMGDSLGDRAL